MKSREKAPSFQGGNTHTHMLGAGGRSGWPIYIYVIYIYIYICYLHKSSTRKRERMSRGDKHKRKIALVHRGTTRAYGIKRGGGILQGVTNGKFSINPFYHL